MYILKKIIPYSIFSILLLISSCGKNLSPTVAEPSRGNGIGQNRSLPDELKGSLDENGNQKKTLVLFSSTICSSCIKEHKEIAHFLNGKEADYLNIFTYMVGEDETESIIQRWANQIVKGIIWPVRLDPGQRLFKSLCQKNVTPCTVIYNEHGDLIYSQSKTHTISELESITGNWFKKTAPPVDPTSDVDPTPVAKDEVIPLDNHGKKSVIIIGKTSSEETFIAHTLIAKQLHLRLSKINVNLYTFFIGQDDNPEKAQLFKDLSKMNWPIKFNQTKSFQESYCPKNHPCLVVFDEDNKPLYNGLFPATFQELEQITGEMITDTNLQYKKGETISLPQKKFQAVLSDGKTVIDINLNEHPGKMLLILSAGLSCQACLEEHLIFNKFYNKIKERVDVYSIVGGVNLNNPDKVNQWLENSTTLWPSMGSSTFGQLMGELITKDNFNLATPAMLLLDQENRFLFGHAYDASLSEEEQPTPEQTINYLIETINRH